MERFSKAYELMGLKPGADMKVVKRAYRKLALRYHPDINPDPKAQERFLLIKKAYEVIIEADKNADFWQEETRKSSRPQRESNRTQPRAEAVKVARERMKRYEAMRVRREAQQFIRFKRSLYYPWTMIMAYASFVMFVLIMLDAFWVAKTDYGFVTKKEQIHTEFLGFKGLTGFRIHFGEDKSVNLPLSAASMISEGTHISYAETMIFRDIPYIHKVDQNFSEVKIDAFNKPPHLFFLLFIAVPMMILFVDKPSAVFYSAGAFARYGVLFFILGYIFF